MIQNKNIYYNLILLLPLLYGYTFSFLNFSIGMILYFSFLLYCLIVLIKKSNYIVNNIAPYLILFVVYVTSLIFNNFYGFLYLFKILSLCFFIFVFSSIQLNGIKVQFQNNFDKFSILFCLYLIIQTLFFYLLKIKLPNTFDLFIVSPYLVDYDSSTIEDNVGGVIRPGSFFEEPAFFANFIVISLVAQIFKPKVNYKLVVFYFASILLSTSSSGILISFALIFWYLFFSKDRESSFKKNVINSLFSIFFISMFIYFFHSFDIGFSFDYLFNKLSNLSTNARFGRSYSVLFDLNLSQFLFGQGPDFHNHLFDSKLKYLNDFTKLIVDFGFFAFLFFSFIVFKLSRLVNQEGKIILSIYYIKGFFSGMWFGIFGVFYMLILMSVFRKN